MIGPSSPGPERQRKSLMRLRSVHDELSDYRGRSCSVSLSRFSGIVIVVLPHISLPTLPTNNILPCATCQPVSRCEKRPPGSYVVASVAAPKQTRLPSGGLGQLRRGSAIRAVVRFRAEIIVVALTVVQ